MLVSVMFCSLIINISDDFHILILIMLCCVTFLAHLNIDF